MELVCDLSNSAISNEQISRSRHYLTLNISETVRDKDTVTAEY